MARHLAGHGGGRYGSAALLAGGRSERMGGVDKQALTIEGEALGPRGARILGGFFSEVLVVTSKPELYARTPSRCVGDRYPGRGPLAGIHAALCHAASDWVYVMACDMPNFSGEYAAFLRLRSVLAQERAERDGGRYPLAVVTKFGGHIEPFHALYSRALVPGIERLLASSAGDGRESSVMDLLSGRPCEWISEEEARAFSPDWLLFMNLNRREEFAAFEARRVRDPT